VIAADPVIYAAWDESPQPTQGVHYIITTSSPASPEFPDIELVEGSLTWRIVSVDVDNEDALGDIGVISSPHADDFAVRIASPAGGAGARDVKAIRLQPSSSSNYSRMTGGTFNLIDELIVEPNSSGVAL